MAPYLTGQPTLEELTESLPDERREIVERLVGEIVERLVGTLAEQRFLVDAKAEETHGLSEEELAVYAPEMLLPDGLLLQHDFAAGDGDRRGGQRGGGRARDHRTVGDLELCAVARAVDRAVRDLVAEAPDMSADRAEGLELALSRLGDYHLGGRVDHPSAYGDGGSHPERGTRLGARRA
jgi:hypothetical protein